jgi:Domain of unknown function (DUF2017)
MTQFRARRKGSVHIELPAHAAALLASLARQLVELLSDGESSQRADADSLEAMLDFDDPRDVPQDPALLRLLPDAHRDDDEAAAEFRRYTERNLRDGKIADAMTVIDDIGEIPDDLPPDAADFEFEIDADGARAWLRCLTDMRLTLAARLGVTAEDEAYWHVLPEDDPRLPVYEIYGWLGYLLESLLDSVRH